MARNLKFNEPTKILPVRVPISKIEEIRIKIDEVLKPYEVKDYKAITKNIISDKKQKGVRVTAGIDPEITVDFPVKQNTDLPCTCKQVGTSPFGKPIIAKCANCKKTNNNRLRGSKL